MKTIRWIIKKNLIYIHPGKVKSLSKLSRTPIEGATTRVQDRVAPNAVFAGVAVGKTLDYGILWKYSKEEWRVEGPQQN